MFNFFRAIRLCILLFCSIQAISIAPRLESSEYEIDSEAIMNDNNVANQIDRLLDIGLKYQKETGKNFDYKKVLKKTYKQLEESGSKVPKEVKKDIERRIKKVIEDRYFCVAKGAASREYYNDPRDKDFYEYEDSLKGTVIQSCIGAAMCAMPCPVIQGIGGYVLMDGLIKFAHEIKNYVFREPESRHERRDNNSNGRHREEREKDTLRSDNRR